VDLSATYIFNAAPDIVWALLVNPEVVAACLPGCERLEPIDGDRYQVMLTLTVAAVGGKYTGTVAIVDKQPPRSYRLIVEGAGGPGFVKGEGLIQLTSDDDGSTIVTVNGRAQVGGVIARVGQRLLGSVSKMMLDRFFSCVQQRVIAH
jgi:carbon monoxide dehydrogenase subunit G